MFGTAMQFPETRYEVHYSNRLVRCFADRPANIDAAFREAVKHWPDNTALVLGDEHRTYAELDNAVNNIAANLLSHGLEPGDRVALLLGNGMEFVELVLATARAGLVAVPMNTRQRMPEIEFVLHQCGAKALVYDGEHEINLPTSETTPSLKHSFVVGDGKASPYSELQKSVAQQMFPDVQEEDLFCLLYTSGTTGKPKGAMLTHLGTVHSILHFRHGFDLDENDVGVLAVPASHVTGLVAIILAMVTAGGTTIIMPSFKAKLFLEVAQKQKMTYTLVVPAMYNLCLLESDFASYDLSSWRIAGFGGAPMPEATITRLLKAMPELSLRNCYGSTETTSPATILPHGAIKTHQDSVGKVLPCADIIILDDDGREVPPGESGELLIGGAMVVPGYWDNEAGNKNGFTGGYWVSGDIGTKDADGFVHVFDRKKDMINRAGFKVYCIEVESVLSLNDSVIECAVIGQPDPVLGEKVHAYIQAKPGYSDAEAIKAWCAERLSNYKVPDYVTFLGGPLPRNPNGKILKTVLREVGAA
jgi:long-chain acyl-CoA synthetase